MSYEFEWDTAKAASNLKDHRVSFDEASTVFGDPLAMLMGDPDHSQQEERYLLLGASLQGRLLVVSFAERPPKTRLISAREATRRERDSMQKGKSRQATTKENDQDTMRPEYDFSGAVRGITAARYSKGANVVVVDPEVLDVFPDGAAVNEALRALAPVLRRRQPSRKRSKVV